MKKEDKYKHGLTTPEDYFESFEERLFTRMAEEALPDTPGFSVPDGYFDHLEEELLKKALEDEKVKVIPLYRKKAFAYVASVAACAVLVFAIFMKGDQDTMSFEIADIEAYLDTGAIDYSSYDVAQLLNENDLENLPSDNTLFTEENLEAYLLENLDDTNLLIE